MSSPLIAKARFASAKSADFVLPRQPMRRWQRQIAALLLAGMACISVPARCQGSADGSWDAPSWDAPSWDRARATLLATAPGVVVPAIARWKLLAGTENQGFEAYAGFVMAWPGFPQEDAMRRAAEKSPGMGNVAPARLVAFFDRFPPLTNPARAQYALALAAQGRMADAQTLALAAWRGGSMSDGAEAALLARFGTAFSPADHEARLEALLWDGAGAAAQRMLPRVSAAALAAARARLALQGGQDVPVLVAASVVDAPGGPAEPSLSLTPVTPAVTAPAPAQPNLATPALNAALLGDPGYVYDRARFLIRHGRMAEAASLLATRPALTRPALDGRKWVALHLAAARAAVPLDAVRIAMAARDGFAPGADIAQLPFAVRDDYTSLMWLGGMQAQWQLGDRTVAAALFQRYATAARTPMTRSKGFYWAGRALEGLGTPNAAGLANSYFSAAAQYPDQYYGLLALEKLGAALPNLADAPHPTPSAAEREAFMARPIVAAVREVARDGEWQTTIRFFREIAAQGHSESDFVLLADLARQVGRRDLAVVAGQAAANAGFANFRALAFPEIPTPEGSDWTMVHAISRQESQFSQNAISHSGARGLMQLMVPTAGDVAHRLGLPASPAALTQDARYNMTLGDAYFRRLLASWGGNYPLAIASYNAGPGNVRRWIASRGDPRAPGTDWVEWIERIPVSETRGYVAHVLENMVVYEAMHPDHAAYKGANPLSHYIGKAAQ